METQNIYGSTRNDLENRIHQFLDDPRVLFRDIKYAEEDGHHMAIILYKYNSTREEEIQ